jgi:hypothetical protein
MKRFTLALTAAAMVVALAAPQARAGLTLADLLVPGATLTCGDKTFSNFNSFTAFQSGGAHLPLASEIGVSCHTDANGTVFIDFQSAVWSVGANQTQDTDFRYTVSNNHKPPLASIKDASLRIVGGTIGDGTVTVSENDPTNLINMEATIPGSAMAHETFSPVTTIVDIAKDIALVGNTGSAAVSLVEQGFSQTPEPASMVLLVMGGIGLAGYGWRRRRAAK